MIIKIPQRVTWPTKWPHWGPKCPFELFCLSDFHWRPIWSGWIVYIYIYPMCTMYIKDLYIYRYNHIYIYPVVSLARFSKSTWSRLGSSASVTFQHLSTMIRFWGLTDLSWRIMRPSWFSRQELENRIMWRKLLVKRSDCLVASWTFNFRGSLWWYVHTLMICSSLSDHPHWAHHHFSENHHESSWRSQGSSPGPCQVGSRRHWKSGRSYLEWGKGPGHWWAPSRCEDPNLWLFLGFQFMASNVRPRALDGLGIENGEGWTWSLHENATRAEVIC